MSEFQAATLPNHEAMNEVAPTIDAFRSDNDLGEEIRFEAAERIDEAANSLGRIEEASGENGLDIAVSELIDDTLERSSNDAKSAVAIGIVDVLKHPADSPRTIFELGQVPHELVADTMHDLDEAKGEAAVEAVIEAIETEEQKHEQAQDALWRTMAEYVDNDWTYSSANASVRKLPLSLPVRTYAEYNPGTVQYATGDDLEQVLAGYGIDATIIEAAKSDNWKIPVQQLPYELRRTMNVANVYETITKSHDEESKRAATERNSSVTLEDIWDDSTLHHVTKAGRLNTILQNGQLGYADRDSSGVISSAGGIYSGTLNFGRYNQELPQNPTNAERMEALSYSTRGDVYIHYMRPEGCYREGEEYIDTDPDIIMMSAGVPSTEISALMIRNSNDIAALESSWESVVDAGFYIPIFSAEGDKLFSREDFDAGKVPDAVQAHRDYQQSERDQAEARWLKEKTKREQEAADRGMTIDEYGEWQRQNIVRPQI